MNVEVSGVQELAYRYMHPKKVQANGGGYILRIFLAVISAFTIPACFAITDYFCNRDVVRLTEGRGKFKYIHFDKLINNDDEQYKRKYFNNIRRAIAANNHEELGNLLKEGYEKILLENDLKSFRESFKEEIVLRGMKSKEESKGADSDVQTVEVHNYKEFGKEAVKVLKRRKLKNIWRKEVEKRIGIEEKLEDAFFEKVPEKIRPALRQYYGIVSNGDVGQIYQLLIGASEENKKAAVQFLKSGFKEILFDYIFKNEEDLEKMEGELNLIHSLLPMDSSTFERSMQLSFVKLTNRLFAGEKRKRVFTNLKKALLDERLRIKKALLSRGSAIEELACRVNQMNDQELEKAWSDCTVGMPWEKSYHLQMEVSAKGSKRAYLSSLLIEGELGRIWLGFKGQDSDDVCRGLLEEIAFGKPSVPEEKGSPPTPTKEPEQQYVGWGEWITDLFRREND